MASKPADSEVYLIGKGFLIGKDGNGVKGAKGKMKSGTTTTAVCKDLETLEALNKTVSNIFREKIRTHDDDLDGVGNNSDAFPKDKNETEDTDSDGYGNNADDCILIAGNSTIDLIGCLDNDGDGW